MTTLNIGGKRVTVDDSFMQLSPEQQNATVDEISKSLGGAQPAAPAPQQQPEVVPQTAPETSGPPVTAADVNQASANLPTYDVSAVSGNVAQAQQQREWDAKHPNQAFVKGNFLPLRRDPSGLHFDPSAGVLGAAINAFNAPGDVYSGNLQLTDESGNITPDAIGRSLEFASTFSPVNPAVRAGGGIVPGAVGATVERPGMEAAAAAQRLGVDLPRAIASDATTIQQGGKILSNVPIAGTPLRNASRNAIDQLGLAADRVQQGYGTGDVPTAGAALRSGITDFSKNTLDAQVKNNYDLVDQLVNNNVKQPLTSTQEMVANLQTARADAGLPTNGTATSIVSDAVNRPEGLNYDGVKRLRSTIGGYIQNPQLAPAGADQGELKAIYGSLSNDLGNIVKASDHPTVAAKLAGQPAPETNAAYEAFQTANSFAKATAAEQKQLDKIIAPQSDEGLFSKVQAMAGSNASADLAQLARARNAVSPDAWGEVSSAVISKMGRDADGNFSPDRFITAYGKLSQNGKNILFRSNGNDDIANSLNDIAAVSRKFKELNQYANPSGTGQTLSGVGMAQGAITAPVSTVGGIVGGRVLATLLSRPVSARALAAYSRAVDGVVSKPSVAATRTLENASKGLAAIVGNTTGDRQLSLTLAPQLSAVGGVPAQQRNE